MKAKEGKQLWAEPAIGFESGGLWAVPVVSQEMDSTLFDTPAVQTRGAEVTETDFYDAFTLYGYTYEGEATEAWSSASSTASAFIEGTTVEKEGNDWTTKDSYFWPAEKYAVKFFAYAPQQLGTGNRVTVEDNTPKLTYIVPADAVDQHDIVVANPAAVQGGKNDAQELTFEHIMTAVKIQTVGSDMRSKVSKVSLKNVHSGGTYNMASSTWTDVEDSEVKTFSQTVQEDAGGTGADSFYPLIDGEQTFMMMPQALDKDAELEIVMDGKTLTAPIGGTGKEWKQGYTVVYKISYTPEVIEYILEMPTKKMTFNHQGTYADMESIFFEIPTWRVYFLKLPVINRQLGEKKLSKSL